MNRYVNVSTAARLAGVSRGNIQKRIRAGELSTFEGKVSEEELTRVYPQVEIEDNAVLERMDRIQRNAINKNLPNETPKEQVVAGELDRLRLELADANAEIQRYRELVLTLKQRLTEIQDEDDCTRRQKLILQALIRWMLTKIEQQA